MLGNMPNVSATCVSTTTARQAAPKSTKNREAAYIPMPLVCAGTAMAERGWPDRRLLVVGMAAADFLGPDEFLARRENLAHGRDDDPHGDGCGDERIENRIAGQADQQAGGDRRQGYVHVADIVNIGEPDRRVVAARREEEPRDGPIGSGGEEADHDGDRADDRGGWSIRSAACHSSSALTSRRPTELKTLAERSRCREMPCGKTNAK